jgi:hypothetical protein
MVEFETVADAQGSMPHVNGRPDILAVHGPKLLDNCLRVPGVTLSETLMLPIRMGPTRPYAHAPCASGPPSCSGHDPRGHALQ